MGEFNSIRTNHDFMSFSIYNFLDNLLAAVRPSETLENELQNRDEVTTQVTPGGFSEDIFIFLSDREKEEYNCSVCYCVVKDAHQCQNGHKFCYSCIYVWSTCNRSGADCCPACRCDGVYARNDQINEKISRKRVKCISEGCNWRGFLRDFADHDHRIYDFRELNTSIELPFVKSKESSNLVNSADSKKLESSTEKQNAIEPTNESQSDSNTIPSTNNTAVKVEEERTTTTTAPSNNRVLRAHMAPPRLATTSGTSGTSSRQSAPRSNLNNYSRLNTVSSRSQSYRNSVGNTHLSRLPRTNVNHDRNAPVIETASRHIGQNESTQTINIADSSNISGLEPIPPLLNSRDSIQDNVTAPSPRGGAASSTARRGLQLPAINLTNTSHIASERRSPMEYRRLAPTFASRRGNFGISPSEGREQLAMMLILLTSDLEDRVTLNEVPRDSIATNESDGLRSTGAAASRPSIRLGRSRLQEFRNLNRRLSEVANSLDRLIASTSRENDRHHTTFNRSPDTSASNTASDADEETTFNGYNQ